jgi:uncharacterized protein YgiM (DUF1202 family)
MLRSLPTSLAAIAVAAAIGAACHQAEEPPRDFESTPASAPAAAPRPTIEVVVASSLNVRTGPGAEHPVVGRLARGEQVSVLEEAEGWKRVRREAGGLEGWVAGIYVQSSETPY